MPHISVHAFSARPYCRRLIIAGFLLPDLPPSHWLETCISCIYFSPLIPAELLLFHVPPAYWLNAMFRELLSNLHEGKSRATELAGRQHPAGKLWLLQYVTTAAMLTGANVGGCGRVIWLLPLSCASCPILVICCRASLRAQAIPLTIPWTTPFSNPHWHACLRKSLLPQEQFAV